MDPVVETPQTVPNQPFDFGKRLSSEYEDMKLDGSRQSVFQKQKKRNTIDKLGLLPALTRRGIETGGHVMIGTASTLSDQEPKVSESHESNVLLTMLAPGIKQ